MSDLMAFAAPALRAEEEEMLREYWRFYEPLAADLQKEMRTLIMDLPEWAPIVRAMTEEQMAAQHACSMGLQRRALVDGDWRPYLDDLHRQGMQYAKAGTKFASWFQILAVFRDALRTRLADEARQDLGRASRIGEAMNRFIDIAMGHIGEAYLATKEQIIREQQEAIREISTPVLQVRDQLLIIPIVGVVDTHRARLLTESLLKAIRERRAKGVVMDITGVPIVDSKVANHLAQACEAARLMGAQVVMTGISSEIALTLVTIGAQLPGVRTMADLQSGVEEIEKSLRRDPASRANGESEPSHVEA
jgi:rsbT co-antagonist protein RsbR